MGHLKMQHFHYIIILGVAAVMGFSPTASAKKVLHLDLQSQPLEITRDTNGSAELSMEGFFTRGEPGTPGLPRQIYDVALPPDVDWKTVTLRLDSREESLIPGTLKLDPALPPFSWDDNGDKIYLIRHPENLENGRDMTVYSRNVDYPETCVQIIAYSQMRKWKFIRIEFTPVKYNPITGSAVLIERADIAVEYDCTGEKISQALLRDTVMDDLAGKRFVNFDSAREWYKSGKARDGSRSIYDYVIITTNAIESNSAKLNEFIQHKSNLGFSVLVITEDEYGTMTGQAPNEMADKIRQWLIENYFSHGITWVLLIGKPHTDLEQVPMKMCWDNVSEYLRAPSDYYYADLTGNWDLDGDEYYGEWSDDSDPGGVDLAAEVYVGRIPVYDDDYEQLDEILEKIIDYQSTEDDVSWRQNVLLPMSFLDDVTDGAYIAELMKSDFLTTEGISAYTMYEQNTTCPSDSIFTSSEDLVDVGVAAHWKNNPYGIETWLGHGWSEGAEIGYTGSTCGTLFSYQSCLDLDDTKPAITFQSSCSNAYAENSDNMSYSLLKSGAITAIGATRVAYYQIGWTSPQGVGYCHDYAYWYNRYLIEDEYTAGKALAVMKSELYPIYISAYEFNLYGDPQIHFAQTGIHNRLYVDKTNGSDLNAGESWGDAFKTIQKAIDSSDSKGSGFCTNIHVAAATYYEHINLDDDIILLGGYPAGGGTRNPEDNVTVINGSGSGRVVQIVTDTGVWIDGFTITNGQGVYCGDSTSIKLTNCIITNNAGASDGGGVHCSESSLMMTLCDISENAAATGGGIQGTHSTVDIKNCLITNNTATNGGGIESDESTISISNSTIADNTSTNSGGALRLDVGSDGTAINSILWGNSPDAISGSCSVMFSDVQGGGTSSGNINSDPRFCSGPNGDYYLGHTSAGQPWNSPCMNAGFELARNNCITIYSYNSLCMTALTTRTDQVTDGSTVDMGFHYYHTSYFLTPTPTITPTRTPVATITPTPLPRVINVPDDFSTIQEAINDARSDDTVLVANGTYNGAGNKNLDFTGKSILVQSETGSSMCIIDCQGSGRGFYFHNGEDENAVVMGFTIRNGSRLDSSPNHGGAGFYFSNNSSPVIRDCIVSGCDAIYGGGLYCSQSSPIVVNCTFTGNTGNSGGGIVVETSSGYFLNCTISGNTGSLRGGGVYLLDNVSNAAFTNCTISGNSAPDGGGIYTWRTSGPHFGNCVIYGNTAGDGGGVFFGTASKPVFSNCTMSGNSSTTEGGGLYCDSADEPIFINCILWGDTSGIGEPEIFSNAGSPNVTYSDVQYTGGWPGDGNINLDPQFVSGPTGNYYLDYASTTSSPCIDAGDDDSTYACYEAGDQDICMQYRSTRLDGGSDGDQVDMGYHYPLTLRVPGDFASIQAAIDAARDGDAVHVADGTYTGVRNKNLDLQGKRITVRSEHGRDDCVIDCAGGGLGFLINNREQRSTVIQGFTVKNGALYMNAGGVYIGAGTAPVIRDCLFVDNSSVRGGGIFCFACYPLIDNCTFSDNTPTTNGGGIYILDASPEIESCTFTNNAPDDGLGGGIYSENSSVSIIGCTFSDGALILRGSGIYGVGSTLIIDECEFFQNSADQGAGLYLSEDKGSRLTACTFSGNQASQGNGMFLTDETTSTTFITDCVFADNQNDSGNFGGGLRCHHADPVISNCLFVNNRCGTRGGGIACWASSPLLSNCTFTGNSSGYGGAISCYGDSSPTIVNSIIWNNPADSVGDEIYVTSGSPDVTYSCIAGDWGDPSDENIDSDPLFASGSQAFGDYYLDQIGGSPCINTGSGLSSGICFRDAGGTTCMHELTTDPAELPDEDTVDMGYHYRLTGFETPTPTATATFTPIPSVLLVPGQYATIQAAVDAAEEGDVVLVADNTYTGVGNREINFNGKAITVESEGGPIHCILDCQDVTHGFRFYNGEGSGSVVQGFTIRNGYFGQYGGGIYIDGSSPTIANCIFENCSAVSNGGGLYCSASSSLIINCLFTGNFSHYGGAVMCKGSSNLTVHHCTMTGNSATEVSGGLYVSDSQANIYNCIIWNNTQDEIYLEGTGSVSVHYSDIEQNSRAYPGTDNINSDPLFEPIGYGGFYLRQTAAGQSTTSPCVDSGGAEALGYPSLNGTIHSSDLTTRTDQTADSGVPDIGFHYRPDVPPTAVPTDTPTPGPPTSTPTTVSPTDTPGTPDTPTPFLTPTPFYTPTPFRTPTPFYTSTPFHTPTPLVSPTFTPTINSFQCPADSIYSQPMDLNDPAVNHWYSEAGMQPSVVYDDYIVSEDICDIHWWGLGFPDAETDFIITFYTDNATQPGSVHSVRNGVSLTPVYSGYELYGSDPIYYYEVEWPDCVTLHAGWVSIQGVENENYFLWITSPDGNDRMFCENMGVLDEYSEDLAFCLTGADATATPTSVPSTETPVPPTVTPTSDQGVLIGSVTLQRSEATPPHESYITELTVTLCSGGLEQGSYSAVTDNEGYFQVLLPPGLFDVIVKSEHALANRLDSVPIPSGGASTDPMDFGTLREGDADNDNVVVSTDFFILRGTYNKALGDPGYDERADFSENDAVTSSDFFLLRAQYNQAGAACGVK